MPRVARATGRSPDGRWVRTGPRPVGKLRAREPDDHANCVLRTALPRSRVGQLQRPSHARPESPGRRPFAATFAPHGRPGVAPPPFRRGPRGHPRRHDGARAAFRPDDDARRGGERGEAGAESRPRLGVALRRREGGTGPRGRDRHSRRTRSRDRGPRRRVRAVARDHQRSRLLRRRALRPARRSRVRLPHALHAHAATDRPPWRTGGRDAGAEQGGRRLRRRRRDAGRSACRPVRGRAAAGAHDRGADRRRTHAPGARDGPRGADEHAALADACGPGLRRVRRVAAGGADGRRHVRPDPDRRRARRSAGRRDRPRHRAGALRHADAGDAADGVPPWRGPPDGIPQVNDQLAGTLADGPLHHRVHRRAGSAHPSLRVPQRRAGPNPAPRGSDRRSARRTPRRAFRSVRCRSRSCARR